MSLPNIADALDGTEPALIEWSRQCADNAWARAEQRLREAAERRERRINGEDDDD